MSLPPDDPRHGTYNGYSNHGCRCGPCRTANTANSKRRRTSGALTEDDPRHGQPWTYWNYGCKCDPCLKAVRQVRAEQQQHARWRRLIANCAAAGVYIQRGPDGNLEVTLDPALTSREP